MFVHGNNIIQKENNQKKYSDNISKQYIEEIKRRYETWKNENTILRGPYKGVSENDTAIIKSRVKLLNDYKNFIDQQHYAETFDSRSNLHSSVLEEFMYYLFRDLVREISENALFGKSHSFKDIFFRAQSFAQMIHKPSALIEKKDHDFAIGASIHATMSCNGSEESEKYTWDIPAIAIECKTYLDKTMLQDASTASEQLKQKNPNAMYIVVAEWLKLTESVNLKKYKIDQIYVLRKQKNTDREFRFDPEYVKNPIYSDVVYHCFDTVRTFLTTDWDGSISYGLDRGFLL